MKHSFNASGTHSQATWPNPGLDGLAGLCKAGGDLLRLQILRVLKGNAYGVMELSHIFAIRQNALSHHLKLLASAGLVTSQREGTNIYYRRAQACGALAPVLDALYSAIDRQTLAQPLLARIEAVQQERDQRSRDFFRNNADKFREQQDLIAGYPQYGALVLAMIDQIASPGSAEVLEVGPGTGDLLPDLRQRFTSVTALDNAEDMLGRARSLCNEAGANDIRYILGDTRDALNLGLQADLITVNMVLHHTPSPAEVIGDLASILRPRGSLIITELCQHHQDWARSACGDLWLGFVPEDLIGWAEESGLIAGLAENLALRNGFQLQIRQFFRPAPTNSNYGLH